MNKNIKQLKKVEKLANANNLDLVFKNLCDVNTQRLYENIVEASPQLNIERYFSYTNKKTGKKELRYTHLLTSEQKQNIISSDLYLLNFFKKYRFNNKYNFMYAFPQVDANDNIKGNRSLNYYAVNASDKFKKVIFLNKFNIVACVVNGVAYTLAKSQNFGGQNQAKIREFLKMQKVDLKQVNEVTQDELIKKLLQEDFIKKEPQKINFDSLEQKYFDYVNLLSPFSVEDSKYLASYYKGFIGTCNYYGKDLAK